MPVIKYNFRKIQKTDLEKSSSVDFGPKICLIYPIFGITRIFLIKKDYIIRDYCTLTSYKKLEKRNNSILRKGLTDGRMDERTELNS